jgi:hypothetical protein
VEFVDLHDTPVRMKEKGVIREIIPWQQTRRRLFWRLRRRLLENRLMQKVGHFEGSSRLSKGLVSP